jgi:hypothetical protein
LHVRQWAWLNTGPLVKTKTGQERKPPRIKQYQADKIEPADPPCDAPYLIEYLFDAGPFEDGKNGMAKLSSRELLAWQKGSGVKLQPWEFRLIRRLSADYVNQCIASEDPNEPPPYQTKAVIEKNRDAVARSIRTGMAAYFMAKNPTQTTKGKGKK